VLDNTDDIITFLNKQGEDNTLESLRNNEIPIIKSVKGIFKPDKAKPGQTHGTNAANRREQVITMG